MQLAAQLLALVAAAICFSALTLSQLAPLARNPLQNLTIDGGEAPGFNALLTGTAHRPRYPWGDMEASLLYAPAVIHTTVKAVAVRAGRTVLGNLCEPLRRRGQSG